MECHIRAGSMRIGGSSARERLESIDVVATLSASHDHFLGSGPIATQRLCVLVVDHDRDSARDLSKLLTAWGHEVWVADDGEVAIELAAAFRTDVALLGIETMRVDGRQVARQLRRQARFEETLLLAMLAVADPEERARAEKAGFDICLVKPISCSTLAVLLFLEEDRLKHASPARRQCRYGVNRGGRLNQDAASHAAAEESSARSVPQLRGARISSAANGIRHASFKP